MVLNDPVFGFRRLGLGPVPQCIDTGVVVFGQGDKLGILRHEEIDKILLARKSLSNVMRHVIHISFNQSAAGLNLRLTVGQIFGN